jgi:transposase
VGCSPIVLPSIHQSLAEKEILPHHHLVDMGYTSARLIVSSQQEYNVDLFGPVAVNAQWQEVRRSRLRFV